MQNKRTPDKLPATLSYKPDTKTVRAWFDTKPTTEDPDRLKKLEKLNRLTATEAELLSRGVLASGKTLEEFLRGALTAAAKSYIEKYVMAGGQEGAKKLDRRYAVAYKALRDAGVTNITPSRLYTEAGTNNYRTAKRWLESHGYTWVLPKSKATSKAALTHNASQRTKRKKAIKR